MPPEEQPDFRNVVEDWPIVDSVLIGAGVPDLYPSSNYFLTYNALGAVAEIPFFNARNKSDVGLAYNTQEVAGKMPYPFKINTIGVEWLAPVTEDYSSGVLDNPSYQNSAHLWNAMVQNHCAMIFYVSTDEKLVTRVPLCPAGMGIAGDAQSADGGGGQHVNSFAAVRNNGVPFLSNRWPFPIPLIIPKNTTFRAVLSFSEYAREILQTIIGPNFENVADQTNQFTVSGIRMSLFGERAVQRRGGYHF